MSYVTPVIKVKDIIQFTIIYKTTVITIIWICPIMYTITLDKNTWN